MLSSDSRNEVFQIWSPNAGIRSACTSSPGRLRRQPGGEQQHQPAGHREQVLERDPQQPAIQHRAGRRPGGQAERGPAEHGAQADMPGRGDAIDEQHRLRAFAQHRRAGHHRKRGERPASLHHRLAQRARRAGHLPAVPGHPDVVPAQHPHGEQQDGAGEQLLPGAGEGVGDGSGERRHQGRAQQAAGDPGGDPGAAPPHADRGGHHDSDDQGGFQHLAEHDHGDGEHRGAPYFATIRPRGLRVEIVEEHVRCPGAAVRHRSPPGRRPGPPPRGGGRSNSNSAGAVPLLVMCSTNFCPAGTVSLGGGELVAGQAEVEGSAARRRAGVGRDAARAEQQGGEGEAVHRRAPVRSCELLAIA